ncbi:MAG: carbamoyl-phosphate synthase large subunit, partial [Mucispirillum sp.]|nr:carbamoyl-phosphate synthase large subunit [Mucispirillum sp.]
MPKRNDIKKVMIIGAGPIVIGQGCEFDYSGVQACKALKNEGYEIVLVNSNPATIMTDPEFADRTYIEPLSADILHEIIRRERPDVILPTLGGQTALNLAVELYDKGVLKRYGVEMIGASVRSINKAEDRQLFKKTMKEIGLDLPRSGSAHTMQEAVAVAEAIGTWPLIIRPGFTLGGTGGGIAHNKEEFQQIVTRGLFESRNSEVLIEESLLGWKEYEMEVMRDKKNNAVIVCSIENFDPMGVHTGDSITVAPIQTLTDREYQAMRDDSLRVMQAIGVETGGANVQWAVNPEDGRRIIIEMNPRVSRSSALASKATGFPIAKIAALLAVGYTLDELINDITGETPACFEPALDYIVTKIPRFTFEKFQNADSTLGTQMKSVGEAMAIGKTFKQSFQKALRSLEIGRSGFGADGKDDVYENMTDEELNIALQVPKADRVFAVRAAFKKGYSVDTVYEYSKIDKYFLRHLQEITAFEDEIKSAGSLDNLSKDVLSLEDEVQNAALLLDDMRQNIEDIRNKAENINAEIKTGDEEVRKYELDLAGITSVLEAGAAQYMEKYGIEISHDYLTYADREREPRKIKEEINRIESRLDDLGPINLNALNDYRDAEERYKFLTDQRSDLEGSIDDINSFINETDEATIRMFEETFNSVKDKFVEVFHILFGNGEAELKLTDP